MEEPEETGLWLNWWVLFAVEEVVGDEHLGAFVGPKMRVEQLGVQPAFGDQHCWTEGGVLVIESVRESQLGTKLID